MRCLCFFTKTYPDKRRPVQPHPHRPQTPLTTASPKPEKCAEWNKNEGGVFLFIFKNEGGVGGETVYNVDRWRKLKTYFGALIYLLKTLRLAGCGTADLRRTRVRSATSPPAHIAPVSHGEPLANLRAGYSCFCSYWLMLSVVNIRPTKSLLD